MRGADKQTLVGWVLVATGFVLAVANLVVSTRMDVAYTGFMFAAVAAEMLGWVLVLVHDEDR